MTDNIFYFSYLNEIYGAVKFIQFFYIIILLSQQI